MYTNLRLHKKGGGVILYVHNSLNFIQTERNSLYFESIMGEIVNGDNYRLGICAIYRPPDKDQKRFIRDISTYLKKYCTRQDLLLIGDINIDLKLDSQTKTNYINEMCIAGLECGISQYTRVEKKGDLVTKSCIDHVFTRSLKGRSVHTGVITQSLADHYITACAFVCVESLSRPPPCVKYKLDNDLVHKELQMIDWSPALNFTNPSEISNFITDKFDHIYNKCKIKINIMNTSNRKICKWINNKAKNMCSKRDVLLQLWKKDEQNMQKRLHYNTYRNKTNKYLNSLKHDYIKNEVTENFKDSKKIWKIINRICGKITKSIDETILKSFKLPKETLANNFANEFQSNVKNITITCDTPILNPNSYERNPDIAMRLNLATNEVIHKILQHLNHNKSPGFDGIRASDLKYINNDITPVITHLINRCIAESVYPDKLKIGIIRPIYKKGSHSVYNNYRPITILSCIDKIVERYFGNEISRYLEKNKVINKYQFGFQRNRSTSQLLCQFTNEINKHLNYKNHTVVIFIDFSKAFDTLRYKTLFTKLQQNGIQGPLLDWLMDYHFNRNTMVKIADSYSNKIPTDVGTAQGSILGPTEYLLYVNDMINVIKDGSIYQFADDTCIVVSHKNLSTAEYMMQNNFNLLCKWAHDVGLVINADKTKAMHIHSSHNKTSYVPTIVAHEHTCLHLNNIRCQCKNIDFVHQHMYIGLIIDHRLNWGPHINYVCDKLRSFASRLAILKYKLPYSILRTLYLALADSIISYGLSSYGRTYKTYLINIYKLQLKLLKTIVPKKTKILYENNEIGLFQHSNILPINQKVKIAILKEEFNCISMLNPKIRYKPLRKLSCTKKYILPKFNNLYGRRTSEYLLPNILNDMDDDITQTYLKEKNFMSYLKKHFANSGDCEYIL